MTKKRSHKHKKNGWLVPLLSVILAAGFLALLVRCAVSGLRPGESGGEQQQEQGSNTGPIWVEVPDGDGGTLLVQEAQSIPRSTMTPEDFYQSGDFIYYSGDDYTALQGVDVSFYQGNINWQQVRASGISFAMIRAGYRGYQQGSVHADENFRRNIEGALAAGLEVGVYFYSQAVTPEEAVEEAKFVLQLIEGYDVTFPVAFDWEHITGDTARTDDISSEMLTEACLAFCSTIEDAGHDAIVYFYRSLGYHEYDMERLAGLDYWFSGFGAYPDYHYAITMWQYSHTATVPGIAGNTDLNLYFIKNE